MPDTRHSAYATGVAVLGAEMNALGNLQNSAAGGVLDNTSAKHLVYDIALYIPAQAAARSAGAFVSVHMLVSLDGGTTYPDINETACPAVATFALPATSAASRPAPQLSVELPPAFVKFFARDATGQALANSGNTLTVYARSIVTS
jgi:hypothetical protein